MKEKEEMIYIWIDDMRKPPSILITKNVISISSFDEAIDVFLSLNSKETIYIDFDHDLGSKKTGYDITKWLVEHEYIGFFHVHSMNPVGANNIRSLLTHYGWTETIKII